MRSPVEVGDPRERKGGFNVILDAAFKSESNPIHFLCVYVCVCPDVFDDTLERKRREEQSTAATRRWPLLT